MAADAVHEIPKIFTGNGTEIGAGWTYSKEFRIQRTELIERYGNSPFFKHSMNVMCMSYQHWKLRGWSDHQCISQSVAAFFHDWGKHWPNIMGYFLSDSNFERFRSRRDRLTRQHCLRGPGVLANVDLNGAERDRAIIEYVQRNHHTRPKDLGHIGQSGSDTVLVVSAVDTFDAWTENRPHRPGVDVPTAVRKIWSDAKKGNLDLGATKLFIEGVLEKDLPVG